VNLGKPKTGVTAFLGHRGQTGHREHFTKSLKFNNGLAHADYSEIGKHLNIFQFRTLWRDQFGIGDKLWIDYNDFKCNAPRLPPITARQRSSVRFAE
jgi:hypothetical protein